MGRALDPKKIKSAQRVLEVLEYFNADRQQGTVMDIARTHGYPQSSTSELLSCLVALGYLHRDLRARTYRPSARVAVLGAWVQPELFRSGALLPMMDELAGACGATVLVASQVGVTVRYIHVVDPLDAVTDIRTGAAAGLLHSAVGRTLLSTQSPEHVRKLAHRLNAEAEEARRVRFDELAADLQDIRTRGYAIEYDDAWGIVSIRLPHGESGEQLALGIRAPCAEMEAREADFVQQLHAAVARHLMTGSAHDIGADTTIEPLRRTG